MADVVGSSRIVGLAQQKATLYRDTGAASVAIALSEAVGRELIAPDSAVVLAAVGAGFNFGASVWRWAPARAGGQA